MNGKWLGSRATITKEPCISSFATNEEQFKRRYLDLFKSRHPDSFRTGNGAEEHCFFCIETEETIHGFPDVMEVVSTDGFNHVHFYEFKLSDMCGCIKFQPTQPAFYKRHKAMNVFVTAYNRQTQYLHIFPVWCLFDEGSPYFLNNGSFLNLTEAEIKRGYK